VHLHVIPRVNFSNISLIGGYVINASFHICFKFGEYILKITVPPFFKQIVFYNLFITYLTSKNNNFTGKYVQVNSVNWLLFSSSDSHLERVERR
jgi:hypothetical protein